MVIKTAEVDNNKIRYLEEGSSENTLLLLHGLGASAERWEYVIPHFAREFRVVVPDLIGFGYSDKPMVDYTCARFTIWSYEAFNSCIRCIHFSCIVSK